VDVALNGNEILGCPIDVNVGQGSDPSKTVPFGPGLESAVVGEPAVFTVQAKDKNWNNVKGGGNNIQAKITGPDGKPIDVVVKDNGNGTYTIAYTPTTPGYHSVDVTLDGQSISDCPRSVPVKQVLDPQSCSVEGSGVHEATTTEPTSFTIQAKDKSGKPVKVGGDDFRVAVDTPAGSKPVIAQVKDNEDGTYTVTYQPNTAGKHHLAVTVDGKPVKAFDVNVKQQTDPSKTLLLVLVLMMLPLELLLSLLYKRRTKMATMSPEVETQLKLASLHLLEK